MNTTKNIIVALVFAFWIVLVATFSIQNIELVSLKFFFLESVKIPVGVFLSIMLGLGFMIGVIVPLLFSRKKKVTKKQNRKRFVREEETESDPLFDW